MDPSAAAWMVASGLGTGLGGATVLVVRNPGDRALDTMTGFACGVMVAALALGLLPAALAEGDLALVAACVMLGSLAMAGADRVLPHVHTRFREAHHEDTGARDERRAWLVLGAMTLHNIPEGMAVGVGFAAGGADLGVPLAVAIFAHNIPEGFAAAAPLLATELRRWRIAVVAALTGLVEIPAAIGAYALVNVAEGLLPAGLALAAGAMLYVVIDELIPAATQRGNERAAAIACTAGFVCLMVLTELIA
jgi:ZIP family zinc transporter